MPSEHSNSPVVASAVAVHSASPGPVTVTDAPGAAVPDTVTASSVLGDAGDTTRSEGAATVPCPTLTVVAEGDCELAVVASPA